MTGTQEWETIKRLHVELPFDMPLKLAIYAELASLERDDDWKRKWMDKIMDFYLNWSGSEPNPNAIDIAGRFSYLIEEGELTDEQCFDEAVWA